MKICLRSMVVVREICAKKMALAMCIAVLILLAAPGPGESGVVGNSASLWREDCMKKSVANKTNFCWALHEYISRAVQGGNPTGKGCTKHMASKGFGANTVAQNMCYWYFTDR